MSGVSSNNSQLNDPTFLAQQIQQNIDSLKPPTDMPKTVVGGDMLSVFNHEETLKRLGIDLGLADGLNPSSPSLLPSDSIPFSLNMADLAFMFKSLGAPDDTKKDVAGFGFDIGGGDTATKASGLTLPVPGDLQSTDTDKVLKSLLAFTGIDTKSGLTDEQKLLFKEVLHTMAEQIASKNADGPIAALASGNAQQINDFLATLVPKTALSPDDQSVFATVLGGVSDVITASSYTVDLQSKDPKVVAEALKSFISFSPDLKLTPEQEKNLKALVNELAANIAAQNSSGTIPAALTSFDKSEVVAFLLTQVDTSKLSPQEQTAFKATIETAGDSISALNAATGTVPAKNATLQGIESKEPEKVLDTMKTILAGQNIPPADIEKITPQLTALASAIVASGEGLDITDANTLKQVIATLLGPNNDVANTTLQKAIAALATVLATENTAYFTVLSKSTDPAIVLLALRALSNIDHNPALSPSEKRAALNYLSLMAQALAFMSQVRAKVAMLEAELRKAENEGKLATIKDQTAAAHQVFNEGLNKIAKDIQKMLDALAMKALMAILGPIIMVILAIIMAIITIFSFGTAAPVAAAIMVAVIVVMTVVAIADMQTGMFEKAGKATSSDPSAQKAASFGFQAIIFAIMIVFSFGMASFMVAAQIAAQTAVRSVIQALAAALKEIVKQVAEVGIKASVMFVVGQLLGLLMSSGLLTDGLVKMFKAMGCSEEDAGIGAMILTILMMIIVMIVSGKVAGGGKGLAGGAKGAVDAGKQAVDTTLDVAVETTKKTASSLVKEGAKAAASAADDAITITTDKAMKTVDEVMEQITKNLSKRLMQMAELGTGKPDMMLKLMQTLGALVQAGASAGQAVHSFNQAAMDEGLAKMEILQSQAQALIDMLKQIMPQFDITMKDVDEASKDFMKMYTGLMTLFADMVSSASAIVSTTAETA